MTLYTRKSQAELLDALHPYTYPELFNKLLVAEKPSPGRCVISGLAKKIKWDVKQGDGLDGASTTRKGRLPAAFVSTFQLALDFGEGADEYDEWFVWSYILHTSLEGDEPSALDVYHPDLADLEITSAVVTEIGGVVHDGKGGATVAVKWLEYRPPKPKRATGPSGSKSTTSGGAGQPPEPPDPNAALKDEVAKLTNQAKNV